MQFLCAQILFHKILHQVASGASFGDTLLPIDPIGNTTLIDFIIVSFNSDKRYVFS